MTTLDASRERLDDLLDEAARVLIGGGTVIFPTETVYGIGCDPHQPAAIERIFAQKARPRDRPLALHLASCDEALEYVGSNRLAVRAIERFLPGPLAVIVARPSFIGGTVTAGSRSLSLRVPDHALCRAILERCGPLAATSANRSGEPPFLGGPDRAEVPDADLLIDAGPSPGGVASTVVDFTTVPPALLREGAIARALLEAELGTIAVSSPSPSNGRES